MTEYHAVDNLESPAVNEEIYASKIADRFKKVLQEKYDAGSTKRMFHPKMHGLVKAEFTVENNLKEEYKKGIFQNPVSYDAWIRLSNAKRTPAHDKKKDMRGMAIKLTGVKGEKLLKEQEDAVTQDFLLVTAKTLQTKSVEDFQKAIYALTGGFFRLFFYAVTHPLVIVRSLRQVTKCGNLFEKKYFSMTPYLFGAGKAVKYAVFPTAVSKDEKPDKRSYNYLSDRLERDLAHNDMYLDFMVQFWEDEKCTPVEDPTVEWKSPFVKLATIRIPRQNFNSHAQRAYGENLSFTPWHSLKDHRPLGGANRARKLVYEQVAAFRRKNNDLNTISEPQEIINFQ